MKWFNRLKHRMSWARNGVKSGKKFKTPRNRRTRFTQNTIGLAKIMSSRKRLNYSYSIMKRFVNTIMTRRKFKTFARTGPTRTPLTWETKLKLPSMPNCATTRLIWQLSAILSARLEFQMVNLALTLKWKLYLRATHCLTTFMSKRKVKWSNRPPLKN